MDRIGMPLVNTKRGAFQKTVRAIGSENPSESSKTMVHLLRFSAVFMMFCAPLRCCGLMVAFVICLMTSLPCSAEQVHYRHSGDMPPGAIGQWQLQRGGPLPGYFQPAEIATPAGCMISLAAGGAFDLPQENARTAAFLIGQVYRFKVTQIPLHEGIEIFPTIELIDRIYPPGCLKFQFPIRIRITRDDLAEAIRGKMVTRVIYVEDPDRPLAASQGTNQQFGFDVRSGEDPLRVADSLGRPVAILRLGARVPSAMGPSPRFLFGCPVWMPSPQISPVEQEQLPNPTDSAASRPVGRSESVKGTRR